MATSLRRGSSTEVSLCAQNEAGSELAGWLRRGVRPFGHGHVAASEELYKGFAMCTPHFQTLQRHHFIVAEIETCGAEEHSIFLKWGWSGKRNTHMDHLPSRTDAAAGPCTEAVIEDLSPADA